MNLKHISHTNAIELKKCSPNRARAIASNLKTIIDEQWPDNKQSIPIGWDRCACVYAQALIKAKKPSDASNFLLPLVAANGLLAHNPVAHATYAKALDNAGRSGEAALWLSDKVAANGLLAHNPVAHATYAKALDNAGRSGEAALWLSDKVAANGLLAHNPVAVYLYSTLLIKDKKYIEARKILTNFPDCSEHIIHFGLAKLEICMGKQIAAMPSIINSIKFAKRPLDKLHSYAMLMYILPEDHAVLIDVRKVLGSIGSAYAQGLAMEWKQKSIAHVIDIPSSSYYGRMTPGEKIALGVRGVDSTARRVVRTPSDPS